MKKLAAVLALVLSAFVVAPGLGASANAADDYTAGVRTSCHIQVPAVVRAKAKPRITVTVRPNAPSPAAGAKAAVRRADQPTGTVGIRVTHRGTSIFSKTVPYDGRPVTVIGPRVTQPGRYVVHATFRTADGTVFKSCQNTKGFDVRAGQDPDDEGPGPDDEEPGPNGGDQNPDGLLPDTGGPNMYWLILGLVLVGSGASLVYAAQRRPRAPLYDV